MRETEADKTTTYENEWATVDPTKKTKNVGFTPQRKPSRNTNFEREWTVRDEVVQPLVEASNTRPFKSRFTHQWGSFSIRSSGSVEKEKDSAREPVIDERPLKRPGYDTPPPR